MQPLENRAWFVLLGLILSSLLMAGLWTACALPVRLSSGGPFLFAVLGLWRGVGALLALALIKGRPSLGDIE